MRLRLLVALAVGLALALSACGDDAAAPDDVDDLGLAEPGVLVVGSDIDFPPFEYREDEEVVGFDIDIMNEIAGRLGVEVEYVDASFDTIFSQLAAGDFDVIISAITITDERLETIDFSDPYFEATQALVVRTDSDIGSVDDLGERDVGAQDGTTGIEYARDNFTESRIVEFPSYPAAFTALETDQIDAVLADLPAADEQVRDGETLQIVQEIDTDEQYGIGMQQGNDSLRQAVNDVLGEMIGDGTYAEIFARWFPEGEVPAQFEP